MITMLNFGRNGRLANQLFQYCSLAGIAKSNLTEFCLPANWTYAPYFDLNPKVELLKNCIELKEDSFEHSSFAYDLTDSDNWNITGYLQSPKYFETLIPKLKFNAGFKKVVRSKYEEVFKKETIAIHIRRGDYVDHSYYYQLDEKYFILALFQIPNWREKNILVFSDQPAYSEFHFNCLKNVTVVKGNTDIQDLCLGSMCNYHILSNSSYSWWMAYLSESKKVIRPERYFSSEKNLSDFWPQEWESFSSENKKIDLTDVTFIVPLQFDHQNRIENANLNIRILCRTFDLKLIICENITDKFSGLGGEYIKTNYIHFHRTKMLNLMARRATTKIIANWDIDVFAPPLQIWLAAEMIRKGADMVYPYDGRFAHVPRLPFYRFADKKNSVFVFQPVKYKEINSTGGAVFFNRESFFEAGGENENFVSWGQEDGERLIRFTRLGYAVKRVTGILYHLEHYRGKNSSYRHQNAERNKEEYNRVSAMSKEDLQEYVKTWQTQNH